MTGRTEACAEATARDFWSNPPGVFTEASGPGSFYERRAELVAAMLPPAAGAQRALEIGCGSGALAAQLAIRGYSVLALDLSSAQLAEARRRLERTATAANALFLVGDLGRVEEEAAFDIAAAIGVLPYVMDQRRFVAELAAKVAPSGGLVLSVTRAVSLFTVVELARHASRFRPSRAWLRIAVNLCRTGLWSGGFLSRGERRHFGGVLGLERSLCDAGFARKCSLDLHNLRLLDREPAGRSRLGAWFARHFAWCTVVVFVRAGR